MFWFCCLDTYRRSLDTVSNLSCQLVGVTKYRYHVLKGDLKQRCRDLLIQICDAEIIFIFKNSIL